VGVRGNTRRRPLGRGGTVAQSLGSADALFKSPTDGESVGGNRDALTAAGAEFAANIQLLGTGLLGQSGVFASPVAAGRSMSAPDPVRFPRFSGRYRAKFRRRAGAPHATLAYDAVALVLAFAAHSKGGQRFGAGNADQSVADLAIRQYKRTRKILGDFPRWAQRNRAAIVT